VDYVVLVRKLMKSLPHIRENVGVGYTTFEENKQVDMLKMTVRIESAMRLRNPLNKMEAPNSFVRVVSPFRGSLCNIETKTVQNSCYPYWMG
jgi:hypothetical protein